ncbi:MAG: transposase [Thermodesulfobacteriota bacterium]|nr:transposase [Thermodesulfobacteriota bacterium]
MPRYARMVMKGEPAAYHVMSRTALDGYPFSDADKDEFVNILKKLSSIYFVDVLGYCVMGNHFHGLFIINPDHYYTDEEIKKRFVLMYGDETVFEDGFIPHYREKWSSLSKFMQEVKQTFSRYFNKKYNRRGTLWGERFKSVIVEKGETLVNCLAYIDLNPLRAGLVERPEDYRWSTLGYHMQTGNKDDFLSFDFGLNEFGIKDPKERIRRYRRYVYEAGAVKRQDKPGSNVIDEKVLNKERKKEFKITRIDRFRNKTRYFTDSGIIGTREFVHTHYRLFKDRFQSKHEKIPKPISGLTGLYSLKRLSEA